MLGILQENRSHILCDIREWQRKNSTRFGRILLYVVDGHTHSMSCVLAFSKVVLFGVLLQLHRTHLNIKVHPYCLIQCPQTLNDDVITTLGATFSDIYSLLFMACLLLLLGHNVPLRNPCRPWTYRLLALASWLLRLWACAAVPHDIYLFIEKTNCMKYQKTKVPVPTPPRSWTSEQHFMTTVHHLRHAPGRAFSSI